jgi:osmoprotectant transport system substrate-binding protein
VRRAATGAAGLGLLVMAVAACGDGEPRVAAAPTALDDDAITVASFDFDESRILAEIYSQALEAGGYTVERAFGLGPRELVGPALEQGLVELVPEYSGTALGFLTLGGDAADADVAATHDGLVAAAAAEGITALAPSPAQDTNAFAVTEETADELDLRTVSDLGPAASTLVLGGPPECPTRDLCLPGLESRYDLTFDRFLPLDAGGPLTHQALTEGFVDVALVFSTDPDIRSGGLVGLEDDLGLQPAENVTPLVRTELVDRWGPPLVDLLDAVSARLSTDELRAMNRQLQSPDGSASAIASEWLAAEGLT